MSEKEWKIPHKPNELTNFEWHYILKRSNQSCEIKCKGRCDDTLEVGHIHAKGLGGEYSYANCRLECANNNRRNGMKPDQKWELFNWFDEGKVTNTNLRHSQIASGIAQVENNKNIFQGDLRLKLLNKVSLLAMSCGTGKTMTMVSILIAINAVLNNEGPRVKSVLWFVKERGLGKQLQHELLTEITNVAGIHTHAPMVCLCTKSGDLSVRHSNNDFVISCPNALWEVKKSNGKMQRSDQEIFDILSNYDTIIWDECDFAPEQMDKLMKYSKHALKFGLTATPVDADGHMLERNFILASSMSHTRAYNADTCVRPLIPFEEAVSENYIIPITHENHERIYRGAEVEISGKHTDGVTLPGAINAIVRAMEEADSLEIQMRSTEGWENHWYSPHVIVKCESRNQARQLIQTISDMLRSKQIHVSCDGWNPTMIFMKDSKNNKIDEEIEYINPEHPFMDAKNNMGRCRENSSRILFLVDMGVRGLNNWVASFLVDLDKSKSVNVQVQFDGRGYRIGPILPEMKSHKQFVHFAHPRYIYPVDGTDKECPIFQARNFTLSMDERIEESNLLGWEDLENSESFDREDKNNKEGQKTLSVIDKVDITNRFIDEMNHSENENEDISQEKIDSILKQINVGKKKSAEWADEGKQFIKELHEHLKSKTKIMMPRTSIVTKMPVSHEKPKNPEEYTDADLEQHIRLTTKNREDADELVLLMKKVGAYRREKQKEKHEYDMSKYVKTKSRVMILQGNKESPGIIDGIHKDIASKLGKRNIKYNYGQLARITTSVIYDMYGFESGSGATANGAELDHPAYHYDLLNVGRRREIEAHVISRMIGSGFIADINELLESSEIYYDN